MQRTARVVALLVAPFVATAAPSAVAGGTDGAGLERALAAVDAARIQADVEFLASDELGGRDSPSPGLRIAARFLRARLVRLGWQPGAQDGYLHTYQLAQPSLDEEGTWAELRPSAPATEGDDGTRRLVFGRDYFLYASGLRAGRIEGAVVFCGGGVEEDFEAAGVRGRWALCLDGDQLWRRRERYAKAAGALGILAVPGPQYDDEPYPERFEAQTRRARKAHVSYPRAADEADGSAFLQLFIDRTFARESFPEVEAEGLAPGTELPFTFAEQRTLVGEDGLVTLENVAGWWPGSDPQLAREVIVLSAHYDHVGEHKGEIYNGADDNASGSAALLAVAEALREYGPMRRSVLLLWVSAEEKGLYGSRAWTEHPWLPDGARAVCNLNLDMVGRNAPESLNITPTRGHPAYNGLTRLAETWAAAEGFAPLGSADAYWERSDHANFERNLKIPVAFLFADVHEDYHKPTDTADKIDSDKIRRVVRLVLRMLNDLQAAELGV